MANKVSNKLRLHIRPRKAVKRRGPRKNVDFINHRSSFLKFLGIYGCTLLMVDCKVTLTGVANGQI